mmetsp:Transcript_124921/g.349897  ORF Transcript_124921/g.349897 Transcript_124921/m.349897 type:complete len:203 (-) Transcript_124921:29-637(-)
MRRAMASATRMPRQELLKRCSRWVWNWKTSSRDSFESCAPAATSCAWYSSCCFLVRFSIKYSLAARTSSESWGPAKHQTASAATTPRRPMASAPPARHVAKRSSRNLRSSTATSRICKCSTTSSLLGPSSSPQSLWHRNFADSGMASSGNMGRAPLSTQVIAPQWPLLAKSGAAGRTRAGGEDVACGGRLRAQGRAMEGASR